MKTQANIAFGSNLGVRHQPSGVNSRFKGGKQFRGYVAQTRDILLRQHSRLGAEERDRKVAGNAPFELEPARRFLPGNIRPYRRGVLLVHGLTDSPYFMRHLASFFQEHGFRVMAISLPGHGTCPGDLLHIRWQEWLRAVSYGVDQLCGEAEEIYLAGLSLGAALSVLHSLNDGRVRGLWLFSPAFRISPKAAWANWHKLYSWLIPAAQWVDIKPDRDLFKYESFPKNAAYQMHALLRQLRSRLQERKLDIPLFVAASADDATVDSSATLEFVSRARHPGNKLVYYTRTPAEYPAGIGKEMIELVDSVVPELNIVSFSHTSIVLPPEDAYYGVRGEYSNCIHYYPAEMERFSLCSSNSPSVLQGEVTEELLRIGVMRRLMYNPHFAALKISMQRFLESLP